MVLVLVCEMLNTAIEEVVNLIARDYKIEAKDSKGCRSRDGSFGINRVSHCRYSRIHPLLIAILK